MIAEEVRPEKQRKCLCGHEIKTNFYIFDRALRQFFVVGSICKFHFQAKKRCARCQGVHRNRKDDFCSTCRPIIRRERKAAAEERLRAEKAAHPEVFFFERVLACEDRATLQALVRERELMRKKEEAEKRKLEAKAAASRAVRWRRERLAEAKRMMREDEETRKWVAKEKRDNCRCTLDSSKNLLLRCEYCVYHNL